MFLVALSLLKLYEGKPFSYIFFFFVLSLYKFLTKYLIIIVGEMLKMDAEQLFTFLKFTGGEQRSLPLALDVEQIVQTMSSIRLKPIVKNLEKEHPLLREPVREVL